MSTNTAIQTTEHNAIDVDTTHSGQESHVTSPWTYKPRVDIFDQPDDVLLVADLPGADPSKIDVTVESGTLTLQAEVAPRQKPGTRALMHEYGIGGFHRRFAIDESIATDDVTAEYRDGTLTIRLPKSAEAKPQRIPVK